MKLLISTSKRRFDAHSIEYVTQKYKDVLMDPENKAKHRDCCHIGSIQYVLAHSNEELNVLLLGNEDGVYHSIVVNDDFELRYDWWKEGAHERIEWNPETLTYRFILDTRLKNPTRHEYYAKKRLKVR